MTTLWVFKDWSQGTQVVVEVWVDEGNQFFAWDFVVGFLVDQVEQQIKLQSRDWFEVGGFQQWIIQVVVQIGLVDNDVILVFGSWWGVDNDFVDQINLAQSVVDKQNIGQGVVLLLTEEPSNIGQITFQFVGNLVVQVGGQQSDQFVAVNGLLASSCNFKVTNQFGDRQVADQGDKIVKLDRSAWLEESWEVDPVQLYELLLVVWINGGVDLVQDVNAFGIGDFAIDVAFARKKLIQQFVFTIWGSQRLDEFQPVFLGDEPFFLGISNQV
jgi:hypothetical protein